LANQVIHGVKPDGTTTAIALDSNGNVITVGSLGGGSEAVQISNGSVNATITDVSGKKSLDVNVTDLTLDRSSDSVTAYAPDYKTIIDEADANTTYIGRAVAGTATSSALWQISKYVTAGTVTTQTTANGNFLFTSIWDNRAALSYS
jgi:hypothetical protein